jgi:hypothetical protein
MRSITLAALSFALVLGTAAPALAQDETQPCNADGQLIAFGDVRAGCTIEVIADVDIFTFAASAGDDIRIQITRTVGSALQCAELRAPDNSVIIPNLCSGAPLNPGPLPLSGIYQLIVSEQANNQIYTFNLSLERLFPLRNPTPIGPGDILLDQEINPVTDIDTFQFSGSAGDEVRIILTRTGTGTACVELRAPNNSVVVPLICGGIDLNPVALPLSGVYQIVVTEQADNQIFTYNLSLTCLSGECPDPPPTCLIDPTYAGNTLTLNFTLGTATPTQWHVAILAFGNVITLWKVPLPAIDPAVSFPLAIPGFPHVGTIGFMSTFTGSGGLACTDLKTVDTGPLTTGVTPELLRRSFGLNP